MIAFQGHEAVLEEIGREVAEVEAILREELKSEVPTVQSVGLHTLEAGGKRLRPALVVSAAHACGHTFDLERARRLGACLEMIHMATLIHDDVIDHSMTRRGVPTAAATFGSTAAILSGDALLAKAMVILAQDGDLDIIRTVSTAVVDLAQGEVLELEHRNNALLDEERHLEVLHLKTVSLISCCCHVGARVAQAGDAQTAALCAYGKHLGLAFQMVDDLLDYRGNPADTGKPRATDFVEGCATLPLIRLMAKLSEEDRAPFVERFGNATVAEDLDRVVSLMENLGVFAEVEQVISEHCIEANAALEALHKSPHTELLSAIVHFVASRDR